ncbi:MAG TPA: S-layer homology domain-containing protein [Thermoanaerobaculia bacterium]|nr:S-layer homology domain-containing protein [Thermoanaerobaculia bacterium]
MLTTGDSIGARPTRRILRVAAAAWALFLFLGATFRVLADCSAFGLPFNDLGSTTFCAEIAEAYFSGLTNGTTATTYAPMNNVTRQQMAAFVTRTLDQSLLRGSRRTTLGQRWNSSPHFDLSLGTVTVGSAPVAIQSDGTDLWVANSGDGTVSRVHASDGKVLQTWTGATGASGVLVAMGRVFIDGNSSLYMIDPTQAGPAVTTVINGGLPSSSTGITFDGNNIFVGSFNAAVSIVTPGSWAVTPANDTFSLVAGLLFDGSNVWVTDEGDGSLRKLDSTGKIVKSVNIGAGTQVPAFDGHNIWVPSTGGLTIVRASDGTVLKTIAEESGSLLDGATTAAFDGERVLVTGSNGISLFHATDLSTIGFFPTTATSGACSDGVSFWVTSFSNNTIGQF